MENVDDASMDRAFVPWLNFLIQQAGVKLESAQSIAPDDPIAVEFTVYTGGVKPQRVIREYGEYVLFDVVRGVFAWVGEASLPLAGLVDTRLEVRVLYPDHYEPLLPELTAQSLSEFAGDYCAQDAVSCGVVLPPVPASADSWKPAGFLTASQAIGSGEVIRIKITDVIGVVEDEYVWVPVAERTSAKWPLFIGKYANEKMERLRVGEQDHDQFTLQPGQNRNALWLKSSDGNDYRVNISLVPRWRELGGVDVEPRISLGAAQTVKVAVQHGLRTEFHLIYVPESYRDKDDWPAYVAMYINHHRWAIVRGVMSDDGRLKVPPEVASLRWYALAGSSVEKVSISIDALPVMLWPISKAANARTGTVAAIPLPNLWDTLSQLNGCRADIRVYLNTVLQRCLEQAGVDQAVRAKVSATSPLLFRYSFANPLVYGSIASFAGRGYKRFTVMQVALGEPQRQESLWDRLLGVTSPGNEVPQSVITVLKELRDPMERAFKADIDALGESMEFGSTFKAACESIISGRVISWFSEVATPEVPSDAARLHFKALANDFLNHELEARLVLRDNQVIPNLFALTRSPDRALILSLLPGAVRAAEWSREGYTRSRGEMFDPFIRRHLSLSVLSAGFNDAKNPAVVNEVNLAFRQSADIGAELLAAAMEQTKADINYAIYTSAEQQTRLANLLAQASLKALAGILTTLVAPFATVGSMIAVGVVNVLAGAGESYISLRQAQAADRLVDYEHYLNEGRLGALFLALGSAGLWPGALPGARRSFANVSKAIKQAAQGGLKLRHEPGGASHWTDPMCNDDGHALAFDFLELDDNLSAQRESVRHQLRGSAHSRWFGLYLQAPEGESYAAIKRAEPVLAAAGWSTHVMGVLRFATPSTSTPERHYALQASRDGLTVVIDFTCQQFARWPMPKAFFGHWDHWERYFAELEQNTQVIVVYKLFGSLEQASVGTGRLSVGGVMAGAYIDQGHYKVLNCPSRFGDELEKQIERLWRQVLGQPVTALFREDIFRRISNLEVLRSPAEHDMRLTVGLSTLNALREHRTQLEWKDAASLEDFRTREKVLWLTECQRLDSVIKQLGVSYALSGVAVTGAPAMEAALKWIFNSSALPQGYELGVLRTQIDEYVKGTRKAWKLYELRTLDDLYDTMIKPYTFPPSQFTTQVGLPSPITGRPLLAALLLRGSAVPEADVGGWMFTLLVRCNAFATGVGVLARCIYAISHLRLNALIIPTHQEEFYLSDARDGFRKWEINEN